MVRRTEGDRDHLQIHAGHGALVDDVSCHCAWTPEGRIPNSTCPMPNHQLPDPPPAVAAFDEPDPRDWDDEE